MEINNKFQNAKIYKIVDIGYNKCYIGSTCEELSLRMARHRATFKSFLNGDKRVIVRAFDIFNEYGVENCKIELIEYYKCDTKQELKRREGEHIRINERVNKCVAGRTRKEYDHDIKNKQSEQNKDKLKEYCRNYSKRKTLCGCGKEYSCGNKNHHEKSKNHQKWFEENV